MTLHLRDYQIRDVEKIRQAYAAGARRVLYVSPTGSGKTVLFAYVAAGVARKAKRVTALCHRDFLFDQIGRAFQGFNVPHGILKGGSRGISRQNVMVSSVFTLAKRIEHYPAPDLIIGDEAHHFTMGSSWGKVVNHFDKARVLGVTASPCRLDGQGLGDLFDEMIIGPTVAELIMQGYLTPAEVYAPSVLPDLSGMRRKGGDFDPAALEAEMDKPKITGDAAEHYLKIAPNTQAVGFCCSIRHCEHSVEAFRARGIPAATVHGKMDVFDRTRVFKAYEKREVKVLFAADLISEGFDCPSIETVILLRPTDSLSLYLQQVGRGIRPAPGKTHTTVLDHAGNTERHGFIDEPRDWQLNGTMERRERATAVPRVMNCPKCFAMHSPRPACPRCGHIYQTMGRMVAQEEGELIKLPKREEVEAILADEQQKELRARHAILINLAKSRGYDNPEQWAFHVIAGQVAKKRASLERDEPTVNGLTEDELNELRRQTVVRAMSKEELMEGV